MYYTKQNISYIIGSRRGRNSDIFDESIAQGRHQESAGSHSGFSNADERSIAIHRVDFSNDESELCHKLDRLLLVKSERLRDDFGHNVTRHWTIYGHSGGHCHAVHGQTRCL